MKRIFPASCVVAAGLAVGASSHSAAETKEVKIALLVAIQANPVEQSIINAFHQVAEKDGRAQFAVFDSDNSVQKELANCNDVIASGKYDAIALKAVAGPPLIACAEKAIAAGIPVVAFGNALGPNADTAERQVKGLTASVVELAKSNGVSLAALVDQACTAKGAKPCNVIYMYGPVAFDWATITRKYFNETVAAKYPDIKVVADGAWNFDPNQARTLTKTLMQSHPETDVIAVDADPGAVGAISALKDIGKVPGKDVILTGGGISKQGKDMIKSGEMFGSTCLLPISEAMISAEYSIKAARGEAIDKPDVEVCAVAAKTGLDPITSANVDQIEPEW